MANLSIQAKKATINNIIAKIKGGKVPTAREQELLEEYELSTEAQANPLIVTSPVACTFFGVTPMTLSNWSNRGMPKYSRGQYDLRACFLWWQDEVNASGSEEEQNHKDRYWAAKADKEEISRDILKASVVLLEDIDKSWCERAAIYRSGIMALKHRLPPMLDGKDRHEMRELIDDAGRDILRGVLRGGKFTKAGVEKKPAIKKAAAKKKPAKKKGTKK